MVLTVSLTHIPPNRGTLGVQNAITPVPPMSLRTVEVATPLAAVLGPSWGCSRRNLPLQGCPK